MLIPLKEIIDLICFFGGSYEFNDPCVVKYTPHSAPTKIYRVEYKEGKILLNDSVEINEPSRITNTIIQRLKLIKHEFILNKKRVNNGGNNI